ncbi:hypothetical protein H920_18094 [Fukomys damarensis]|uniref:Uncharacterized protein n=1 Tax=Fukomys damarensis TaxID=885580 RepID=A0A091CQT0_FUKDA|nr:hypothetical protein H920_18094 [Fukomys damarensis]
MIFMILLCFFGVNPAFIQLTSDDRSATKPTSTLTIIQQTGEDQSATKPASAPAFIQKNGEDCSCAEGAHQHPILQPTQQRGPVHSGTSATFSPYPHALRPPDCASSWIHTEEVQVLKGHFTELQNIEQK